MFGIVETNYILFVLVALWMLPWKGFALWRAAKRGDKWWFIIFLVVNTLAILEILYLVFTRKKDAAPEEKKEKIPPSGPTPI